MQSSCTGRDIYDARYHYESGSKANRLRAFWQKEENVMVGKLMGDMLDYACANGAQPEICRLIVSRLLKDAPGPAQISSIKNNHTGSNSAPWPSRI